jgi:hypothetical protein
MVVEVCHGMAGGKIFPPLLIAIKLPILWGDVCIRGTRPVKEAGVCFDIEGAQGGL